MTERSGEGKLRGEREEEVIILLSIQTLWQLTF